MKRRFLPKYHKWMTTGRVDNNGLCNSFSHKPKVLKLFAPEREAKVGRAAYWGYSGTSVNVMDVAHEFCPLRQNIVLLMAAMNNEL